MPPNCRISVDDAVQFLTKFKKFFLSSDLPHYSHDVWRRLSDESKNNWTAHNWYNNVKRDKRKILTIFKEKLQIEFEKNDTINSTLNSSVGDNDNTFHIPDPEERNNGVWFDCYLSKDDWTLFQPLTMENLDEKIQCKLRPDLWVNALNRAFYLQNRFPCLYSFVGAQIDTSSDIFLKVSGHCRSTKCNNDFYGYCNVKPQANNDELHLRVKTKNTRQMEHESMCDKLDQERKRQMEKERTEKNSEIPRKKSRETARKVTTGQDENLELSKKCIPLDPIQKIYHMQFERAYIGSLHDVSYSPFYVHYGLPEQIIIYKKYSGSTRCSSISIGVANDCIKKLNRPRRLEANNLAMYVIVVEFDNTLLSVYQMLAQEVEISTLEFWFKRWLRRVMAKPKQIVIPYRNTILAACAQSFNDQSIEKYIDTIFSSIMKGTQLPCHLIILKFDLVDIIHTVLHWSCLQRVHSSAVREFYVKCVILMASCGNLQEFREIFASTCIVAVNTYKNSRINLEPPSTVDIVRRTLQNRFLSCVNCTNEFLNTVHSDKSINKATFIARNAVNALETEHYLHNLIEKLRTVDEIREEDIGSHECNDQNIAKFLRENILSNLLLEKKGTELNAYFLPAIIIELFRLGTHFPLWSAVVMPSKSIHPIKNVGQKYVENIKSKILRTSKSFLEVDDFLKAHMEDLRENCSRLDPELLHSDMENENSMSSKKVGSFKKYEETSSPPKDQSRNESQPEHEGTSSTSEHNEEGIDSPRQKTRATSTFPLQESPKISSGDGPLNCEFGNNHSAQDQPNETHDAEFAEPERMEQGQGLKSKHFQAFTEVKIANQLGSKSRRVFFLRNAQSCPAVPMDGKLYLGRNTCAFDSISRILINCALEDPGYYAFLERSTDPTMKFINSFITKAPKATIWKQRTQILLPHYQDTVSEYRTDDRLILCGFDCWDNLRHVWKIALEGEPTAYRVMKCANCDNPSSIIDAFAPNHWIIARKGFSNLQAALNFHSILLKVQCHQCKNKATEEITPNHHIFIELDIRMGNKNQETKKCQLKDFPHYISLNCKYRLAGVIELKSGHYTAYCRRLSGRWEYYDDMDRKMRSRENTTWLEPHGVIYVLDSSTN